MSEFGRAITESVLGQTKMAIGKRLKHPDGYMVKIVDGQWWGSHGLSNFWYWRRIKKDGSLSRRKESGYGWC